MQVDRNRVVHEALARLSRLEDGEGVLLQPFKKDRFLCVVNHQGGYLVLERGFARNKFVVETKKIRKVLKALCRKEFPRSRKVWLTQLSAEETHGMTLAWFSKPT